MLPPAPSSTILPGLSGRAVVQCVPMPSTTSDRRVIDHLHLPPASDRELHLLLDALGADLSNLF